MVIILLRAEWTKRLEFGHQINTNRLNSTRTIYPTLKLVQSYSFIILKKFKDLFHYDNNFLVYLLPSEFELSSDWV